MSRPVTSWWRGTALPFSGADRARAPLVRSPAPLTLLIATGRRSRVRHRVVAGLTRLAARSRSVVMALGAPCCSRRRESEGDRLDGRQCPRQQIVGKNHDGHDGLRSRPLVGQSGEQFGRAHGSKSRARRQHGSTSRILPAEGLRSRIARPVLRLLLPGAPHHYFVRKASLQRSPSGHGVLTTTSFTSAM